MEAAKCVDAHSCFPGHCGEQADTEQAFIQADLCDSDVDTFARIPRECWPKAWQGMRDPVVLVKKALYGHPDAPGMWEKYCEEQLAKAGFQLISENWL